ncbi:HNH endonuclease [Corynebacterium belfantii]|uniref:HNH endonuclease n=1 Tax=Corynebacterium belfantii TaxID=2014537 RepID=UPI00095D138E|nr:HNH endonuclease signature motif containing protein [Corynebacterium belfantii]OLN14445.1 HNH endonuclease [Corynebacterium diphtheriae] [Corynebacterium diphtheriae subsp. lausannense]STC67379.1 putative bacteriophage holin protein [Corynebacterium diphtheriae]MBG9259533.1 HNH endonuclease [Corynebacterium belfantii]MBG9266281.1 HNH endonuclease [Corynebacterium belfantii]MBG9288687.1 HNH endonuclease [Corynebacterium belfantii]
MPKKPARPCSALGCPELTHDRFCSKHAKTEVKRYRKYQRDPKINRRYGSRWRKIRAAYIAAHPLCEDCLAAGSITPVQEVHHVLPLEHGGSHDFANLRSLCKPCHSRQSALDGDRWRQAPQVYTY